MAPPRAALLLALAVLALLAAPCGGVRATWEQNDVPEGGFSRRGREEAAKRKGKTYRDEYESSGSSGSGGARGAGDDSYTRYYNKYYRGKNRGYGGAFVTLALLAAGAWWVFKSGGHQQVWERLQQLKRAAAGGRSQRPGAARSRAVRPDVAAAADDAAAREAAVRRMRIQRFAQLDPE